MFEVVISALQCLNYCYKPVAYTWFSCIPEISVSYHYLKHLKERNKTPNEQPSVQAKESLLLVAAPWVDLEKYPGGEDGPGSQLMHQQCGVLHEVSANLQIRVHFR
jgi:hypothetical protein